MDELIKRFNHIMGNNLPAMNFDYRQCMDNNSAVPTLPLLKDFDRRLQEMVTVTKECLVKIGGTLKP